MREEELNALYCQCGEQKEASEPCCEQCKPELAQMEYDAWKGECDETA